jgi:hypothetical protein
MCAWILWCAKSTLYFPPTNFISWIKWTLFGSTAHGDTSPIVGAAGGANGLLDRLHLDADMHLHAMAQNPQAFMHRGYTEGRCRVDTRTHIHITAGTILILLALQTRLLSLQLAQKAFLLGLVMFIVLSALMQSAFDILEPHLLQLGMPCLITITPIITPQVRARPFVYHVMFVHGSSPPLSSSVRAQWCTHSTNYYLSTYGYSSS